MLHLADRVGRADELVVVLVHEHLHVAVQALDFRDHRVATVHQLLEALVLQHSAHILVDSEGRRVDVHVVLFVGSLRMGREPNEARAQMRSDGGTI